MFFYNLLQIFNDLFRQVKALYILGLLGKYNKEKKK